MGFFAYRSAIRTISNFKMARHILPSAKTWSTARWPTTRAGEYRLDIAWKFDKVLELSEQHGIYQKICIDYVRYISPRGERRKTFDPEDNAYSASNGGPCRDMRDFFALPEARRMFKNRLR